jgi:hypothetical protein
MIYDIIFTKCSWVSTTWQCSVNCTQIENKELYTWGEAINKIMNKHSIHTIEGKTFKTRKKNKK